MTYDKLETKNLYSPHFGECRSGKIDLKQDPESDLMIGSDAANYEVRISPSYCYYVERCGHQQMFAMHATDVGGTTQACSYTAKPHHLHARVKVIWGGMMS